MNEETVRYIFSRGALSDNDFSILFKNDNGNVYLPVENIKELYVFSDCTLTTKFISLIGKHGIILHFFDYYGNYVGTFYPKENLISGNVTVKQALCYENKRVEIAKAIVLGISKNIYTLLYHYYRHGNKEIKPMIDYIHREVPAQLSKYNDIKQVLMIKGNMWNTFYSCFNYILQEDFTFNKRVRRPPDNPLNALISFCNSILYTRTISAIYQTHLNQSISFLHEPSKERFSLSLDLSEVFKPILVFQVIFDCVNRKKISVEKHFIKEVNYCVLNDAGRKIILNEFDKKINSTFKHDLLKRNVSYKQAIKLDGYKLIKYIVEGKEFVPFCEELKR